jgi:hypothetical protein
MGRRALHPHQPAHPSAHSLQHRQRRTENRLVAAQAVVSTRKQRGGHRLPPSAAASRRRGHQPGDGWWPGRNGLTVTVKSRGGSPRPRWVGLLLRAFKTHGRRAAAAVLTKAGVNVETLMPRLGGAGSLAARGILLLLAPYLHRCGVRIIFTCHSDEIHM